MLTKATHKPGEQVTRQDLRLRAVHRRELQKSVMFSALVVAAGVALAALASCLVSPGTALAQLAISTPIVLSGLGVARTVTRAGRHRAVPLGMMVGVLPLLAIATNLTILPARSLIALGSLGLTPLAMAVFIPLERRQHVIWLALANLVFFGPILAFGSRSAILPEMPPLLVTAGLSSSVSLIANEVELRRRAQINAQLRAMRGLYSRMKEHEQDLRRQDEFLFMQQETLVVQQAELLRLNEELESIARLDALTGLGNRLRLNEDLAQTAARIERSGGTVGLLLMDLDRFKRLNDSAGHLAGDAALRGVADVLRKTSRSGDGVYRYGGEEFLVILHDCDESVLEQAGQRYISAIANAGMPHPDNSPWNVVTASAGARELSQTNCTDIDAALHDADEALYVAKASGRNRLEIHPGTGRQQIVALERRRAAS